MAFVLSQFKMKKVRAGWQCLSRNIEDRQGKVSTCDPLSSASLTIPYEPVPTRVPSVNSALAVLQPNSPGCSRPAAVAKMMRRSPRRRFERHEVCLGIVLQVRTG